MPAAEYLIRPSSHDGWLVIPASSLVDVLTPRGYALQPGDGFGDLYLQAADYVVAFCGEDPGWQVIFDGDIVAVDTDALIAQVARQIADFTGTATEWVRYT